MGSGTKSQNSQNQPSNTEKNERLGWAYFQKLKAYIAKKKGLFLRDEDGSLHVLLSGQRILLSYDRNNQDLAWLMFEACDVSTLSTGAQAAIQRLQVYANGQAGKMKFRRFSALSADANRLYVPVKGGKLLLITTDDIKLVPNGENADSFWIEHPYADPIKYSQSDPRIGLEKFEELLVDTQSCRVPEMKWLVAMHEGLFPYIRDAYPARLILIHIGASQQGKTTGALRFIHLHGLKDHQGNYSVASLRNLGDIGLIVLDNKEQRNFDQELIDFCLFLATGAELGRSFSDGRLRTIKSSPVGVITSIEGVHKQELQKRCVEVEYYVPGNKIGRGNIQREISQRRDAISSAILKVLQVYFKVREKNIPTANPLPDFEEHFRALSDLLRAFGTVAGRPEAWAEGLIEVWDKTIAGREVDENELEHPLNRIFTEADSGGIDEIVVVVVTHDGKNGKLYVTDCASLLTELQKLSLRDLALPKTERALGRRLRSGEFKSFKVLDEKSAPHLQPLKRQSSKRPIGFFVDD